MLGKRSDPFSFFIKKHIIRGGTRLETTYSATEIAKYFLLKDKNDHAVALTNLKLQKILYYAQGWYLANFGKPLFEDPIEAWKFGPAIRSIYQQYKDFGNRPLTEEVTDDDVSHIDSDTKAFLDKIWDAYKGFSGTELVFVTHNAKPWREARRDLGNHDNSDNEISKDALESYFRSLISNGN